MTRYNYKVIKRGNAYAHIYIWICVALTVLSTINYNQLQPRVYLETEAKLFIQRKIKDGKIDLAWSYMLDYENSANPDIDARNSIYRWRSVAARTIITSPTILADALRFHEAGFGIKDSLHIACALGCKADFFMTVDKGILANQASVAELRIINPVEFINLEV